jgi:hypothetical protein
MTVASHSSIQGNRRRVMTDEFHDFAAFPRRWERPSTSPGRWSLGLLAGFIVLMSLLIAMTSPHGVTNDVILTCTTVAAFGSAFAAGVAAMVAVKRKGEQSIVMLLPLFMGGIATIVASAVIVEWICR